MSRYKSNYFFEGDIVKLSKERSQLARMIIVLNPESDINWRALRFKVIYSQNKSFVRVVPFNCLNLSEKVIFDMGKRDWPSCDFEDAEGEYCISP